MGNKASPNSSPNKNLPEQIADAPTASSSSSAVQALYIPTTARDLGSASSSSSAAQTLYIPGDRRLERQDLFREPRDLGSASSSSSSSSAPVRFFSVLLKHLPPRTHITLRIVAQMDTDDNDYNVTFYLPCGLIDDDVQLPRRRHRRLTSSNGADSEPSSSAAQVRLFSSYCSTQAHQTPHTPHRCRWTPITGMTPLGTTWTSTLRHRRTRR